METKAVSRYVRIAPRKARIVVDLVRGKSVPQAREILAFCERAAAETVPTPSTTITFAATTWWSRPPTSTKARP